MSAITIQQMAKRVSSLLTERLGLKGRDLGEKLQHSGRRLPRKVRQAAMRLEQAAAHSYHPKLMLQIDEEEVATNYDICLRHLRSLNRGQQQVGTKLLGRSAPILLSLIAAGALIFGVLLWQGLL
jgi:hypothetical protein